jgi:hypothetical protein
LRLRLGGGRWLGPAEPDPCRPWIGASHPLRVGRAFAPSPAGGGLACPEPVEGGWGQCLPVRNFILNVRSPLLRTGVLDPKRASGMAKPSGHSSA